MIDVRRATGESTIRVIEGVRKQVRTLRPNDAINQGVLDPSAFIAKPFSGQDLTSKIREALDAKKPLLDSL